MLLMQDHDISIARRMNRLGGYVGRNESNCSSYWATSPSSENTSMQPKMRVASNRSAAKLTGMKRLGIITGLLILGTRIETAFALKCFSCVDCTNGGTLSARIQQCSPTEDLCTAVFRTEGVGSVVMDRGCASSLSDHGCQSDEVTETPPETSDNSLPSVQCCTTDLCNSWGDAHGEGYRRSQEYFRNLMEGTPRNAMDKHAAKGVEGKIKERALTDEDNSAHSMRGAGGSRLATVLVIVGTFAQALWLAGSLLQ